MNSVRLFDPDGPSEKNTHGTYYFLIGNLYNAVEALHYVEQCDSKDCIPKETPKP